MFNGPVKLLIIERALLTGKNNSKKEGSRQILTRLIISKDGQASSELKQFSTVDYQYNSEMQLISITEKKKDGNILEETKLSYSEGALIKKIRFSKDGTVRDTRNYKYDESGNLIFENCGSRNIKYEYDNENRLCKEFRYYGREPELALLYTYDSQENITKIITMNSKGTQIRTESFTWENDLLTSRFCLNENNVIIADDIFEYSCFHDGNWLKRVKYSLKDNEKRKAVDVIYRSITYSDNYPEVIPIEHKNLEILKEEKQALSFIDGSTYRGNLIDGKMDGHGYIQWTDGSSYKGNFKNNEISGEGILTWPNGDIYSGSFYKGQMEGIGRLRWHNGKIFYGLFENNKRTNQGIIEED